MRAGWSIGDSMLCPHTGVIMVRAPPAQICLLRWGSMSIRGVRQAIVEVRGRIQEWDDLGPDLNSWLEEHTCYALIDPILIALGWNIHEPKECHPQWKYPDGEGRVDYALHTPAEWSTSPLAKSRLTSLLRLRPSGPLLTVNRCSNLRYTPRHARGCAAVMRSSQTVTTGGSMIRPAGVPS